MKCKNCGEDGAESRRQRWSRGSLQQTFRQSQYQALERTMLRVAAVSRKRQTRSGLALFLCLLFAGFCTVACSRTGSESSGAAAGPCNIEPAQFTPYRVDTVFDGDTLRLVDGDKVRLIGINTPERGGKGRPAQPLAMEATASLKALIGPERRIFLRDGQDSRDRYGRRLASGLKLSLAPGQLAIWLPPRVGLYEFGAG